MPFQKSQINNIQFFQSDLLDSQVFHGFFTRKGGGSKAPYDALNVSEDVGDNVKDVVQNRKLIEGIVSAPIVYLKQIHSNEVQYIDKLPDQRLEIDGIVTKKKGLGLCIQTADCQAALFYDPVEKVIGAAHAGWRGLKQHIYGKIIEEMKRRGSSASNIFAVLGPSLGIKHSQFVHFEKELPRDWQRYRVQKNYFDLKKIAVEQLLSTGIAYEHIEISEKCSYEDTDFFSYRREKRTGRVASVLTLL